MKTTRSTILAVFAVMLASTLTAPLAMAQRAAFRITCSATDNGQPASGSVSVMSNGREVATGTTGTAIAVPRGEYDVVVTLDGSFDRPSVTEHVVAGARNEIAVTAEFRTAILEISVEAGGQRVAAMATITRNGTRVGSLGAGVPCHLSVGTYDVVVRYRGTERRFDGVSLSQGERRALTASF